MQRVTSSRESAILALLYGLISNNEHMRAFFDESGDDPRDKIYVLAGWVGDDAVWSRFGQDWNGVLTNAGIQYFKHNEARALKKQFAGHSPVERDRIVGQLVEVVCAHKILGLIASFKHPLYQLLFEGSEIPRHQLKTAARSVSSPYYFCFHLAVSQLLRYLVEVENIIEPVDFIFDDRNDVLRPCIKLYDLIRESMPTELRAVAGTAKPGNDRIEPALQVADLLAGQTIANVRARAPEPTLQTLRQCRIILKCQVELSDLSRFKATIQIASAMWKILGLDSP